MEIKTESKAKPKHRARRPKATANPAASLYGVTTDNNPLSLRAWLQHALEEALDMANYLQVAISKLDNEGN